MTALLSSNRDCLNWLFVTIVMYEISKSALVDFLGSRDLLIHIFKMTLQNKQRTKPLSNGMGLEELPGWYTR